MKVKITIAVLNFLFFFAISTVAAGNIDKKEPAAFLPERTFEFEPAVEGSLITHDFIIQNKGTAPLVIHKVRTG